MLMYSTLKLVLWQIFILFQVLITVKVCKMINPGKNDREDRVNSCLENAANKMTSLYSFFSLFQPNRCFQV